MKTKLSNLSKEPHTHEIIKGSILAFALKIIASGTLLVFNVVIGRLFGAEGAGVFFLALSITTVASVLARVGLDNALLRYVSALASKHQWGQVKGLYSVGMRIVIVTAVFSTSILFFSAAWVSHELFNKPELTEPLRWMSLSILPFVLLNLHAESLKGLKKIRDAVLLQGVWVPLGSLLLIYPLSELYGILGAVWAYTLASFLGLTLGLWAWTKALERYDEPKENFPMETLVYSCKPLFIIAITGNAIIPFAPIIFLGLWGSSEDLGIFGSASRIAALVGFILVTMNNVVAPKFSELFADGDIIGLERVARNSSLVMILLASPLFLLIVFNSQWVMGLFGEDFTQGGEILIILTLGQLVNLASGSVGFILMMSGQEKVFRNLTVASALLLVILCFLLIPIWGLYGAAIASSVSVAILNISSLYMVRKNLKVTSVFWLPKVSRLF